MNAITLRGPGGFVEDAPLEHLERPVLGGRRTYFHCPRCELRLEILYWRPHLACRDCHDLAYAVENEWTLARRLRRLRKPRERLGQTDGNLLAPFPSKPKWTRWPTYQKLRRQALITERAYWSELAERFGLLGTHDTSTADLPAADRRR